MTYPLSDDHVRHVMAENSTWLRERAVWLSDALEKRRGFAGPAPAELLNRLAPLYLTNGHFDGLVVGLVDVARNIDRLLIVDTPDPVYQSTQERAAALGLRLLSGAGGDDHRNVT